MDTPNFRPAKESIPGFVQRAHELRDKLRSVSVDILEENTGSEFIAINSLDGEFSLKLFGSDLKCKQGEFIFYNSVNIELPEFQQLLLLYYFSTADGTSPVGKYVSFADLPGGRMYAQAFQGYSGDEIVKKFGEKILIFKEACEHQHGLIDNLADAAYTFDVLPRIKIQVIYWLGDEDFPSSCKILFDAGVTHYVPIDACAIIGSNLVRQLIKYNQATDTTK